MSELMTERSARLEERIVQLTSKEGGLSPQMRTLYASRDASDQPVVVCEQSCSGDESFETFVMREIKWLEDFARNFFLMGTACSMVAMAMLVSTDFSSVGATMFAVISVVGGFTLALWTWCAPRRSVRDPSRMPVPTRTDLKNEVVKAPREERCEVALF